MTWREADVIVHLSIGPRLVTIEGREELMVSSKFTLQCFSAGRLLDFGRPFIS
jgi:hypothetical protein